MGRAGCKFIVHFSTLFSTTRNFVPKKNGTLLSCRLNHSQLCHLSGDFGECRFGGLLFVFPFNHTRMITRVRSDHWSIWINQVFRGRRQCEAGEYRGCCTRPELWVHRAGMTKHDQSYYNNCSQAISRCAVQGAGIATAPILIAAGKGEAIDCA